MYQVSLFNNDVETIIHYPTSENEAPHLDKLDLKEGLSLVDSLSFILYPNNPGYSSVFELTTKIKIIDTRDNSIRFTGRVLDINEKMDSNGLFYKEITCEGALSYLNDTKTRGETNSSSNPTNFLTQILNVHNSKVDSSKQIQLGNVDVTGSITYKCSFKTSLETILEVKDKLGGDIRVRETNGILYLDWLQSFSSETIGIALGTNMKDMVKGKDVTSLGTRIIPLGANNLTIASVNNGLDYIEDLTAKNTYGVIEKTVTYSDITNTTELYNTALADLSNYTQPLYLLESSALDLSYLSSNKAEQFILGANLHITNSVMGVDSEYKIVQLDLDLLKPYDPRLTIANFPFKLSTTFNNLDKNTVKNDGVYGGVQVGDSFGIRSVREDGKVTTTVDDNGISIENAGTKVFYVDTDGNIVANNGTYNDIIANEMKTSNTTNYMILHDQWIEFFNNSQQVAVIGYETFSGSTKCAVLSLGGHLIWNDPSATNLKLDNSLIATQDWVNSQGFAHISDIPSNPTP